MRPVPCLLFCLAAAVGAHSCVTERTPRVNTNTVFQGCDVCHPVQGAQVRSARHFKQSMRCVVCHGQSRRHTARPTVPPDLRYAGKRIDYLCSRCHQDDCRHAQASARPRHGQPARTCADCHGAHTATLKSVVKPLRAPSPSS